MILESVGKVTAAMTLASELARFGYDFVVNLGTAGSRDLPPGSLVKCQTFVQWDMDVRPISKKRGQTYPERRVFVHSKPFLSGLKIDRNAICYTSDQFLSRDKMMSGATVHDMEGYALARVCEEFGVPFISIKCVSDAGKHTDWGKNMAFCRMRLREAASQIISLSESRKTS